MPTNEIIGLDLGRAKTGIARASEVVKLAEPLMSLPAEQLHEKLKELIDQNGVQKVVVGLPRNLANQDTDQTKWVRRWVKTAQQVLPEVKFYFQDEALTSAKAKSHQLKARSSFDEHALSATVILQDFVDTPESDRLLC